MEELREKIAISLCLGMYGLPSRDYNDLHDDSKEELRISAAAALRAIEDAGFAIVPKELPEAPGPRYSAGDYSRRNWEAAMADLRPLNLEEPRG